MPSMRNIWLPIAVALLAGNASAGDYCEPTSTQQRFERAERVVLAKVTESTYPTGIQTNEDRAMEFFGTATLVVTKSWKGPYVPGTSFKAGPPDVATGVWNPRPVKVGDEVLVFGTLPRPMFTDPSRFNLLWLDYCGVTDAAHSGERLAFLDSLAKPKTSSR